MGWVAFILAGGIGVPTAVFLLARTLVYRQSDPAKGQAYLTWFRAQKAAEAIRQQHPQPARMRGQIPGVVELHLEDDDYEYLIELEVEATPR